MLRQYKKLGLLLLALSTLVVIEVKACTSTPLWSTTAPPVTVVCGPGEKLNSQANKTHIDACIPCQFGYYQNQTSHRSVSCLKCSIFREESRRRVLVDDCTRFHDIVETCRIGSYMNGRKVCKACTICGDLKFVGQACTETSDAVCCDREDQLVKKGACVAPEDFCPHGEFLVKGKVCRSCEECKPCFNVSEESNNRSNTTNIGDERKQDGISVRQLCAIVIPIAFFFLFCGVLLEHKFNVFNLCLAQFKRVYNKLPCLQHESHSQVPQTDNDDHTHEENPLYKMM